MDVWMWLLSHDAPGATNTSTPKPRGHGVVIAKRVPCHSLPYHLNYSALHDAPFDFAIFLSAISSFD